MEDFDIERIATEATVAHETKVRQTYRAGIMKLADGNDLSAKEGDAFYAAAKELGVAPPAIAEHVTTLKTAATYRAEVERERELTAANHKRLIELATAIKEAEAKLLRLIPHGRVGETHDIAQATVWLASDLSDYVNGATLYVDGGMTLYPEFRGNG